jgi:N-acyl-D-aspartate/D-glutamate deacylase
MAKDAHIGVSRRIVRTADIGVFDPATVGSSNRGEGRYDLPSGGKRMVMPSREVHHTIVNGVLT